MQLSKLSVYLHTKQNVNKMTKQITIKNQTQPKSVLDMTPFELSQIDQFQNRNRGFIDDDEDYRDDDYFWED